MTNNNYRRVEKLLYNYKMKIISIENDELEIEYLKSEDGLSGISYDGIKTSPTNKTGNPTEDAALSNSEKIHYLEHRIKREQLQIDSIDRAMKGLTDIERVILKEKYIEGRQWWEVCSIAKCSESTGKRYRTSAINKLIMGIYGEKQY